MATIFIRTILIYLFLIITMRLMGKRQAGQLEISELVITFMLSELAVLPVSDKNVPLLHSIIPIFALLSFEVILSFFISKSATFKKMLLGKPYVVIKKGVIDQKGLSKLRLSPTELMSELRLQGISSIGDVDYAIVEDNGQLSVFSKRSAANVTPADLSINVSENGIGHCVIVNGKIHHDNLTLSGKSEEWVKKLLKKKKLSISDIYLLSIDDNDQVITIMKERS